MMPWEKGLEQRLRSLKLREMTRDEYDAAIRVYPNYFAQREIRAEAVNDLGRRVWEDEAPRKKFDLKEWCGKLPLEGFDPFRRMMISGFGVDPMKFDSIVKFSFALLRSKCSEVYELRGNSAQFIRECLVKAIQGTPFDKYPLVEENLVQYDQRASYPAAYSHFTGIPRGLPSVIKDLKEFEELRKSSHHFYIRVKLLSFRCKHRLDPYPMIRETGFCYWDRFWLEALEEHYDMQYEFIDGLCFKKGYQDIESLTRQLWNLRNSVRGKPSEIFIKRALNLWWGRSIRRGKKVNDIMIKPDELDKYSLVYSYRQVKDSLKVRLIKPFWMPWQIPQFGVNVISWARREMQGIIYKIVDSGGMVYHTCTDSLLVHCGDEIPIGEELGQFKLEYSCRKFICLASRKRAYLFRDGSVKNKYGKKEWEWWESQVQK
jgi:hypothetical protein